MAYLRTGNGPSLSDSLSFRRRVHSELGRDHPQRQRCLGFCESLDTIGLSNCDLGRTAGQIYFCYSEGP